MDDAKALEKEALVIADHGASVIFEQKDDLVLIYLFLPCSLFFMLTCSYNFFDGFNDVESLASLSGLQLFASVLLCVLVI